MLSYQPTFRISHDADSDDYTTHYQEGPLGYLVAWAPHAGQDALRQVFDRQQLAVMCEDAGLGEDTDAYRVLALIMDGATHPHLVVSLDQALAATVALCRWSEAHAGALLSAADERGELTFAQEA